MHGDRLGWLGVLGGISVLLTACAIAAPPSLDSSPAPSSEIVTAPVPTPTVAPATPSTTVTSPATPTATSTPLPLPPTATIAAPPPTPPAESGARAVVAEYGTSGRHEIALTFDAGADRGYAEEILDLFAAEGVTASFGILGQWAEANPDLVQRMVAEGHMLFNHSWSHASLTGASTGAGPLTAEQIAQELARTEHVVAEITGGYEMRPYFRPPYGDYDAASLTAAARNGYPVALLWSCDSRDSLGATAAEILASCIDTAQPGRIVLLHVGAQSAAYEALPRMIATLRERGFAFVTAEQILAP